MANTVFPPEIAEPLAAELEVLVAQRPLDVGAIQGAITRAQLKLKPYPRHTQNCVVCAATITDAGPKRLYCSTRCQKRAFRQRQNERLGIPPSTRAKRQARQDRKARQALTITRACDGCGVPMPGVQARQRYCSSVCRQRQRQRQEKEKQAHGPVLAPPPAPALSGPAGPAGAPNSRATSQRAARRRGHAPDA